MCHYTHFIHTIYLLKGFRNNYFPMALWLEHNGEVHRSFYSVKLMKEGIFPKCRGDVLAKKDTMFRISKRG